MALIHFIIGTKGGIGKSFVAATLAQYYFDKRGWLDDESDETNNNEDNKTKKSKGIKKLPPPKCYDLDPQNGSFSQLKSLQVDFMDVMTNGEVDKLKFDPLITAIVSSAQEDVFIIDTGSTTYSTIISYMVEHQIADLITENQHQFLVHTIISGGSELLTTQRCFNELGEVFPENIKFALWINKYHGRVDYEGKTFEDSETYKKYVAHNRIKCLLPLPEWGNDTETVISEMFKHGQTFREAIDSHYIMIKQRLTVACRKLFNIIKATRVCEYE